MGAWINLTSQNEEIDMSKYSLIGNVVIGGTKLLIYRRGGEVDGFYKIESLGVETFSGSYDKLRGALADICIREAI